MGPVTSEFKKA